MATNSKNVERDTLLTIHRRLYPERYILMAPPGRWTVELDEIGRLVEEALKEDSDIRLEPELLAAKVTITDSTGAVAKTELVHPEGDDGIEELQREVSWLLEDYSADASDDDNDEWDRIYQRVDGLTDDQLPLELTLPTGETVKVELVPGDPSL